MTDMTTTNWRVETGKELFNLFDAARRSEEPVALLVNAALSLYDSAQQQWVSEVVGKMTELHNPKPEVFMGTGGGRPFQDELDAWNAALDAAISVIQSTTE